MRIGIDFGTSYSAAAARVGDRLEHIQFNGLPQFRTAVFFPTDSARPGRFPHDPEREGEVAVLVRAAKAEQTRSGVAPRSEAQLYRDAVQVVRRQWLEAQAKEAEDAAADLDDAVFGEEAIDRYLEEGSGHLVQSPKSMLGYDLLPRARQTITGIAAQILEHIRMAASEQLDIDVRLATIGRPVQFRSSLGPAGGEQALDILAEAAQIAGFEAVDFLEEPVAAALHYHAGSEARHSTLVVDIGGGTTDIAHAHVGGSEAPVIHRAWGLPNGGTDVDLALSMAHFMPLFGRGDTRVPAHHFVDAAMVQDMPRQRAFHKRDFSEVPAPYNARLQDLAARRRHHAPVSRGGVDEDPAQRTRRQPACAGLHRCGVVGRRQSRGLAVASVDFLGRLERPAAGSGERAGRAPRTACSSPAACRAHRMCRR